MGKQYRVYGLMAGITLGFAVWGSVRVMPQAESGQYVKETAGRQEREAVKAGGTPGKEAGTPGAEALEAANLPRDIGTALHAQSAVLMDGDTGRILYEKNGGQFRPMASTTKIMTCILALENGNGDEICEVSSEAAAQPKVHLGAPKGTKFYLNDLLYSLMLESHNDAAVMIAEKIGGSVEGFAAMMNQKARDIGCTSTCFITPNGLDAAVTNEDGSVSTHGTTAANLAAMMRYCVMQSPKRKEFLEVTRTSSYSFFDISKKRSYSCVNHNALLEMVDGALSGKTGFTGGAGYSYVAALESGGRTYILALLGCGWPPHKTYKWADARLLFSYGKENYHYREIREKDVQIPLTVDGGMASDWQKKAENGQLFINDPARITASMQLSGEDCRFRLLMAEDERLERKLELPEHLTAPVNKGDFVGCVTYSVDGMVMKIVPLYADQSADKRKLVHVLHQIWSLFILPPG